jgi:hypothetical protein
VRGKLGSCKLSGTGVLELVMNPLAVAAVVLLGVLVGVAIPVLLQLRQTLKTLDGVLSKTGKRLDEALDEISDAAQRINSLGKELEEGATRLRLLFDVAGDIGKGLTRVRGAVSTASLAAGAIGPAIGAAIKALWQSTNDKPEREETDEAALRPRPHPEHQETLP